MSPSVSSNGAIPFGVVLPGHDLKSNSEHAQALEAAGADSIWVYETGLETDAITPMAVYAAATERVRVCSGVIPVWTRNPALMAQTAATLDLLAPGRIVLGLGAWWDPLAARLGVERRTPIRVMREVVEALRLLLARETEVSYEGSYAHLDRAYLDHDGAGGHDVKIFIGAVGPQMLRLAGRIADGVVLNGAHTVDAIRDAVGQIAEGAASAGRSLDELERVMPLRVLVTRDKRAALQRQKLYLSRFLAQQPHVESPSGIDPELAARVRAMVPGGWPAPADEYAEAATLVPDEAVEALGCVGEPDEVRERLRAYLDAGVTLPVTVDLPSHDTLELLKAGFP